MEKIGKQSDDSDAKKPPRRVLNQSDSQRVHSSVMLAQLQRPACLPWLLTRSRTQGVIRREAEPPTKCCDKTATPI